MHSLRFYVATSYGEKETAKNLCSTLEAMGHSITYKWFDHLHPNEIKSQLDMNGVRECDVFILLTTDTMKGGLVEFGIALDAGKRIYVVGDASSNVFYAHPAVQQVERVEQVLERC